MKIIIDKSFIQAKTVHALAEYQPEFDFVVTESLLYETCKADPDERRSISRKLLSLPKNIYYTSVTSVLTHEAETSSPYDPEGLARREANTSLLEEMSATDSVTQNIQRAIEITELHYNQLYSAYIPYLASWRDQEMEEIIANIRLSANKFPGANIDSSWGTYNLIAGLKHYGGSISGRYQQQVLAGTPPRRVMHDLIDIDYAVLGIIFGGIATRDDGIVNCMKKICGHRQLKVIS